MSTPALTPKRLAVQPDGRALSARRVFWPLAACCFAFAASAAYLVHSTTVDAASTERAVVQVSMRSVQFAPVTVEVKKGSVVEWRNDDLIPHTATSPAFDSTSLASGQTWRHTFTETGTFPYACTFHPHMKGTVIVK